MSAQAGRKCAIYYRSGGTYGSPTWTIINRISDVQRPQSRSTNDRMYRAGKNKKKVLGYMEYGLTFKYHPKASQGTDTVLDALLDSFINETVMDIAIMDGKFDTGTTRKGVRGPFQVAKCDRSEADEEGVTYDVELVEVEDDTVAEVAAFSVTTA